MPEVLASAQNQHAVAMLTQFLLSAGMINRRRYQARSATMQTACQCALDNWLQSELGDIRCLSPRFSMQLLRPDQASGAQWASTGPSTPTAFAIEICWQEGAVCHWSVGAGLDHLEQAVPSLGSSVLDILERKGSDAYPLFTPGLALDEASYLYWRGEDDETLVLDEDCGDDLAARDAMRRDMVTRADIAAAFPPWALDYHRSQLNASALRAVAETHGCSYVRRAAALASALQACRTTSAYCPEQDGPFVGFGAVLCWCDGDLAVQISDDYANYAWQGEYCDEIGKIVVPLESRDIMRRWMRGVRPNLRAIALIDALLWHLAERE